MVAWLILLIGLVLMISMMWSVITARNGLKPQLSVQFFLPDRLFISLILLANFWLILLLLLGLRDLSMRDGQTLVIIISLFAPFLSWWRQKRAGEDH